MRLWLQHLTVEDAPAIGKDSGVLSGIGENGIAISSELEKGLDACDGVIDFTAPQATVALSKIVAEHNCIHVIGTTGCTAEEDARNRSFCAKMQPS